MTKRTTSFIFLDFLHAEFNINLSIERYHSFHVQSLVVDHKIKGTVSRYKTPDVTI